MRITITILLFTALALQVAGQEYQVMFYNVENLFDIYDDPDTDDDEFLPHGSRRWTAGRYRNKLNALARAVTATGEWELPSVIGLCEVENETVVSDLARRTLLAAGNYGVVHRESPDRRGIDVALLYRRDHFSVAAVRSWLPGSDDSLRVSTRNLLYVKLTGGTDTLHLIVGHLPSRRGGVMAAAPLRESIFRLIASKCDSLAGSSAEAAIVVMGDFNVSPDDRLMELFTGERGFVNMAADAARQGIGSYWYRGMWEMFDQIVVSAPMADGTAPFYVVPGSFRVADEPFLLTDATPWPGRKPFATYGGYRWSGGYSDHLPVVVTIATR